MSVVQGLPSQEVLTILTILLQASPVSQGSHLSHLSHLGITKSNIASLVVQLFVTLAFVQGSPVVVVPTSRVAASHWSHLSSLFNALFVLHSRLCVVSDISTKGIQSESTGVSGVSCIIFTFASAIICLVLENKMWLLLVLYCSYYSQNSCFVKLYNYHLGS